MRPLKNMFFGDIIAYLLHKNKSGEKVWTWFDLDLEKYKPKNSVGVPLPAADVYSYVQRNTHWPTQHFKFIPFSVFPIPPAQPWTSIYNKKIIIKRKIITSVFKESRVVFFFLKNHRWLRVSEIKMNTATDFSKGNCSDEINEESFSHVIWAVRVRRQSLKKAGISLRHPEM